MLIAYNILRAVVALIALLFLVIGFRWLIQPEVVSQQFAVLPNGLLGWATMRADFGSFFLVAGVTGILATTSWRGANYYLSCCAMLMAFAAFGRLIGFILDGIPEGGFTPFIVELITITLLVGLAAARQRVSGAEGNP